MRHRIVLALLLGWAVAGCQAPPAGPQSLNDLSLEVTALHTLYLFQLTPEQMRALQKLAPETSVEGGGAREAPKASEAYRKVLAKLREAFVKPEDDEHINKLLDELDDLREKEDPQLDDAVDITEEARKRAPEVLKQLSARQVMAYLGSLGDEVTDPLETLHEALDEVRGLKDDEWKELRQTVGPQVGALVAGLDAEAAQRVSDRVVQWLIRVRALSDEEFQKERGELREEARKIVGDIAPTDVLRHFVEHGLAELLSNPRLEAALQARLKDGKR
jgi:hypothetical protein